MYQSPNPMDPLDTVKRWYRQLWPLQRATVWLTAAGSVLLLLWWITR